jgi:hypothetical protein
MMNIHLSKPGGQREGPFTLEQINSDLAARKYHDTDYWAWYEGLNEWVPLHTVPGVSPSADSSATATKTAEPATQDSWAETQVLSAGDANVPAPPQDTAADSEPETPPSLQNQLSSALPFAALERIFILTTGEAPTASRSAVTVGMLETITGEEFTAVREKVPRDAIAHCDFLEKLRRGGAIPDVAWRAVAKLNPDLVKQARDGVFRICVRSFPIETGEMVTLLLFYNKQQTQA